MIPIPSAITSSALESLPGINDCHTSSSIAKHKQKRHAIIIWFLDLLLRLFILKNPKIEYSIIWINLSQDSNTNRGIESPGILDIDKINKLSKNCMVGHLGIEFTEIGNDYIKGKMAVDNRTTQPFGILNGGVSVAL